MQVIKHIGLFWKDYIMGKRCQLFLHLLINNKLESDFKIKASYFNSFFASKYTPLINNSTVSNSLQYVPTAWISSFSFNEEVISNIVNALKISKANRHDDISIQMIWSYEVNLWLNTFLSFSSTTLIIWSFDCYPSLEVEVYFYIYLKRLIGSGIKDWFVKFDLLEPQVHLSKLIKRLLSGIFQGVFWMVEHLHRHQY